MTRRPTLLVLIAALFFISTFAFAQRSSPPTSSSSSSSSSSGGGHASSVPSSAPSAPSYSPSHSGGASYPGGSSSSRSNSGSGNPSSHSGGWNHAGGSPSASGNTHSNPNQGGSAGRGNHNSGASHGTPRFHQGDTPRSNNHPNRPGSQLNATPRSLEPAPTMRGNASHNDSGRTGGFRTPNTTHPQPGVHDGASKQPNAEHRSRMSRVFLFWKHPQKNLDATSLAKRENPEIKRPNPCKGAGCKPVCLPGQTLENGACGSTPTKPQPPQEQIRCPDGSSQVDGRCPALDTAYSRSSGCSGYYSDIDSLERQLQQLYEARDRECARDPNGLTCANLTNQIVFLEQRLQTLRQLYFACMRTHP